MIPAAVTAAMAEIAPALRTVQDISAIGSMIGSGGGRHGLPLGMGHAMQAGMAYGTHTQNQVAGDIAARGKDMLGTVAKTAVMPFDPRNFIELNTQIATLIPTIANWGEALLKNVDNMSQFDANMAQASAVMKMGELRRAMRSADVTGESTEDLARNWDSLMDELQPIRDAITIIMNNVVNVLIDIAKAMLAYLRVLMEAFKQQNRFLLKFEVIIQWLDGTVDTPSILKSILEAVENIEDKVRDPGAGQEKGVAFLRNLQDWIAKPDPVAGGFPPDPLFGR